MPEFKNRIGERYGRLLVTSHVGKDARNTMSRDEFLKCIKKIYEYNFSGSTECAAVNTNRNFIGIEMDDKYFEIATKRINEA